MMLPPYDGFDWDDGNREKCLKHGVSAGEIEALFGRQIIVRPDAAHSLAETRFQGVGTTVDGRSVFLVFTVRPKYGAMYKRPISARYMHQEEVQRYEEDIS